MRKDPFGREVPVDWSYDAWPSGEPYDWGQAARGTSAWDQADFHLDLGCGRHKKARIGVDRFDDPGVDLVFDFDSMVYPPIQTPGQPRRQPFVLGSLPIPSASIESIVSHHAMEHVGDGFVRLMDECWRILKPGGILRIIVPLFPSASAVVDPDHRRYFHEDTFQYFASDEQGNIWTESFATPYNESRFIIEDKDITPMPDNPFDIFVAHREIRVALRAVK